MTNDDDADPRLRGRNVEVGLCREVRVGVDLDAEEITMGAQVRARR